MVRLGLRTFILLLLTAVAGVCAIPQTDRPETSYDETDTPLNQVLPEAIAFRIVQPPKVAHVRPKSIRVADRQVTAALRFPRFMAAPVQRDSHSLQHLLCTLRF